MSATGTVKLTGRYGDRIEQEALPLHILLKDTANITDLAVGPGSAPVGQGHTLPRSDIVTIIITLLLSLIEWGFNGC